MSKNLIDILKKSKAIMNHDSLKVKEQNKAIERELPEFQVSEQLSDNLKNRPVTHNSIMNSKLPNFIKEAMIENPIDIPNPYDVESNPAYSELLEENITKQSTNKKQLIGEVQSNGLSESLIRLIVKDEIEKALKEIRKPVISETQIQKTMVKMIKEGKLIIKKK